MSSTKDSKSAWVECVVLAPSILTTLSSPENKPTRGEGLQNILNQFGNCEESLKLTFPESYPYRTSSGLN